MLLYHESSCDFQEEPLETAEEADMLTGLSLMDTAENEDFLNALKLLSPRELEVVLGIALYDWKPAELAQKFGLTYQSTMTVYYRVPKKLCKQIGE